MKKENVNFIPRYEIDTVKCQMINQLAGKCFNNKSIVIEMGAVYRVGQPQDYILLSLMHLGIEAELYVSLGEGERLLGLELKYLEHDYISYVIVQELSQYGIGFKSFLGVNEQALPLLMACQLIIGEMNIAVLLGIDTLVIEKDYLQESLISLPKDLPLKVSSTLFETKLSVNEIRSLSVDELVLVYPK
ncbi:hypothetical protein CKQ84_18995 [Shewanella sp. WE21]|jgi:hypothetical protein|uniref:hypothetical protein n=1 Tax=Shewanella sp. WE21 TaxID=2029986 RepID=UPI000CF62021|nr:hypothetical protein [Shewanella sp. WE21]AVI67763.1 hypothetical protein CKQ84_18995 [Shewanella sp. WE21]